MFMDATAKWLVTLLDLCVCHPCVSDCLSQLKVNLKAQLNACILEVYTVGNLLQKNMFCPATLPSDDVRRSCGNAADMLGSLFSQPYC